MAKSGWRAVPDVMVHDVCKIRQEGCCRYLACGPDGFECLKLQGGWRKHIDARVAAGKHSATSLGCDGWKHELGEVN